MHLTTHATSLTGPYLYSDTIDYGDGGKTILNPSPLNEWAIIPLLGCLAGVARCVLAIIHIVGHLLASIACRNSGHLKHALKGLVELLRGVIEATPVVGNVFAAAMAGKFCCQNGLPAGGYFLIFVEVTGASSQARPESLAQT